MCMSNEIKATLVAFCFAVAGCSNVTKEQLATVESKADNAVKQSIEAIKVASLATKKAEAAQQAADNAIQCCAENRARIDAMFEKAMYK